MQYFAFFTGLLISRNKVQRKRNPVWQRAFCCCSTYKERARAKKKVGPSTCTNVQRTDTTLTTLLTNLYFLNLVYLLKHVLVRYARVHCPQKARSSEGRGEEEGGKGTPPQPLIDFFSWGHGGGGGGQARRKACACVGWLHGGWAQKNNWKEEKKRTYYRYFLSLKANSEQGG